MTVKTILLSLAVLCAIHATNALSWPWGTTTTTAAPVLPRETFLAEVEEANAAIQQAVELGHATIKAAEEAETEANMAAQMSNDVAKFFTQGRTRVSQNADYIARQAASLSLDVTAALTACVNQYDIEITDINDYVTSDAKNCVSSDMKDVRDTATAADALLPQIADVVKRAQELAAKPDSEYSASIAAILKEAEALKSKAVWNNSHIDAVLHGLQWCSDVSTTLTTAQKDMAAVVDYLALCMRRGLRAADN